MVGNRRSRHRDTEVGLDLVQVRKIEDVTEVSRVRVRLLADANEVCRDRVRQLADANGIGHTQAPRLLVGEGAVDLDQFRLGVVAEVEASIVGDDAVTLEAEVGSSDEKRRCVSVRKRNRWRGSAMKRRRERRRSVQCGRSESWSPKPKNRKRTLRTSS